MTPEHWPTLPDAPDGYLTVFQAGERLGVSARTVRRWAKANRFPGTVKQNVPGGWRFLIPVGDVEAATGDGETA